MKTCLLELAFYKFDVCWLYICGQIGPFSVEDKQPRKCHRGQEMVHMANCSEPMWSLRHAGFKDS